MDRKQIPNGITIIRLILILPVIFSLLIKQYEWTFYLFMLAGVSDALDGFLARRYQWTSRFGAIVDPVADKSLMTLTYLALGYLGHLPLWLVGIVIGRDLIIIIGAIVYKYMIEEPAFAATFISKLNTVLQMSLVVFILFNQVYDIIPEKILEIGMYVVASTTVSSLLDYVWIWGRRAWLIKRVKT